ncbi:MAG TPA: tripartite tricarboxylate transporter substrate-binding protein [Verrucomicrobiae bacterium]
MGTGAAAGWDRGAAVMERFFITLVAVFALVGCDRSEKPYPSQAITIVCPWGAGGGSDRLSRFMADHLQMKLGQPVVVVNKTGGSGAVGFSAGANAPADGYTITMATFELSTMHWLGISKLDHQNFTPLVQLNADAAAIILPKNSPYKTLDEFLKFVRENPGKLRMSGTAKGAAWDLARMGFLMAAGLPVDSVVWVPAKGAAPAIVELLGGHIDAVCCSVPEAMTQIESGELRALAVMSPERLKDFPNIPTVRELGVDWEAVGYRGLALPDDAPEEIVKELESACMEIAHSEAFATFMKKNGFAPEVKGAAAFGDFLKAQDEQWHKVIVGANVGATSISGGGTKSHDPGPWAMPTATAVFVVAGCAYHLARRKTSSAQGEKGRDILLLAGAGIFAVYLLLLPVLGFFTMTAVLCVVVIRFLRGGWRPALVSTVLILASVYLLFVKLFRVPLPTGMLF